MKNKKLIAGLFLTFFSVTSLAFALVTETKNIEINNEEVVADVVNVEVVGEEESGLIKSCTREYLPVCGVIDTEDRCISSPCPVLVEKTFANKCLAESDDVKVLHQGACLTKFEKKHKELKNNLLISLSEAVDEEERVILFEKYKKEKENLNINNNKLNDFKLSCKKLEGGEYKSDLKECKFNQEVKSITTKKNLENILNKEEKCALVTNSLVDICASSCRDQKKEGELCIASCDVACFFNGKSLGEKEGNVKEVEISLHSNQEINQEESSLEEINQIKRKTIINKKSQEIFSKFDFFTNKLNAITLQFTKIISTKTEGDETLIVFNIARNHLKVAKQKKTEAWVYFHETSEIKDKIKIQENIKQVKVLLNQSKQAIRKSFENIKKVVELVKF